MNESERYPIADGRPALPPEALETGEHRVRTPGDPEVFQWLRYLAEADEGFRTEPRDMVDYDLDEHRRRLAEYSRACESAGLNPQERGLLDAYFGFRKEGPASVSEVQREFGMRQDASVYDAVRQLSVRLGHTGVITRT